MSYKETITYVVEGYQRGYKWTNKEVTDLLNDIYSFEPESVINTNNKTNETKENLRLRTVKSIITNTADENAKDSFYCLQPVTVKKKEDNKWEIIDGQQRLTTIYIILSYIYSIESINIEKINFNIEYNVRKSSCIFLKYIIPNIKNSDLSECCWDEFLKNINEKKNNICNSDNYDNSDNYNMFYAYMTIKNFFEDDSDKIKNFYDKLMNHCKVIWYEIPEDGNNSVEIFTRLNSGKVPLKSGELIKAFLIIESRENEKKIYDLWTKIEYFLEDDKVWYYLNGFKDDRDNNRIEFVLELAYIIMMDKEIDRISPRYLYLNLTEEFNKATDKAKFISDYIQTVDDTFQALKYIIEEGPSKIIEFEENYLSLSLYYTVAVYINWGRKKSNSCHYLQDTLYKLKEIIDNKTINEEKFKNILTNRDNKLIKTKEDLMAMNYYDNYDTILNILMLHNIYVGEGIFGKGFFVGDVFINKKNHFDMYEYIKIRDGYKAGGWTLEHINAQANDGQQEIYNLALLSKSDNSAIGDKPKDTSISNEENLIGDKSTYISNDCKYYLPPATRNIFSKSDLYLYKNKSKDSIEIDLKNVDEKHSWKKEEMERYFYELCRILGLKEK